MGTETAIRFALDARTGVPYMQLAIDPHSEYRATVRHDRNRGANDGNRDRLTSIEMEQVAFETVRRGVSSFPDRSPRDL